MPSIFLEDARIKCLSGIGNLEVKEYLSLISEVYKENGGIKGQRAPLKTKTGINIRKRMVEDLQQGAILPPIVIGAVVEDSILEAARNCTAEHFADLIRRIPASDLSIIDGMQRTTAIEQAIEGPHGEMCPSIRIDLWLAKNLDSLVYRMLVLNTGQVPWDIKRQLETIYRQLLNSLESEVDDITVFSIDEKERRSAAGQYRSTRIVELFLAFTSRKPHIEIKEKVAEDFARMEATEATANKDALPAFIETMKLLAALDKAFSATSNNPEHVDEQTRFKEGRDIFTSAPASIGFSAAASQFLLGKPGYNFDFSGVRPKIEQLKHSVNLISEKIDQSPDKSQFIDYLSLNQKISARSGRIGEYEREFFFKAFEMMIKDAESLESLTPCWFAL